MAWIENIKQDYTITTGDGKKYKVNWLNANRVQEFNVAIFNFHNVAGSRVDRGEPMGTTYEIEIFFQGEDNLNISTAFKVSSRNRKKWSISHPLYGTLDVQPISLRFDDSAINVTRVSGQVMETITANNVRSFVAPVDHIQALKVTTDANFADTFTEMVGIPVVADITQMKANIGVAYRLQAAYASTKEALESVINTYNQANAYIDAALSDLNRAITSVQVMVSLPQNFINSIFSRVKFLVRVLDNMYGNAANIVETVTTPHLKRLFENNVAALISTICATSVFNTLVPTDEQQDVSLQTQYQNRTAVLEMIEIVSGVYNDYITNLDALQTDNGGGIDNYIPNPDSINQLTELVKFTISNLFDIAANAKQERTIITDKDSNLVVLAYELYGLLPDDSTITQLKNDNNVGGNELLQIKKGREIVYYI